MIPLWATTPGDPGEAYDLRAMAKQRHCNFGIRVKWKSRQRLDGASCVQGLFGSPKGNRTPVLFLDLLSRGH
jgi:hypothetical protein